MLEIDIPGQGRLQLRYLVSDYNGTLAVDGKLIPGLAPLLTQLAEHIHIHVVTADTFGLAAGYLEELPVTLSILPADTQDQKKAAYLADLGPLHTVAMGNGRNDRLMLKAAALGIAITEAEGTCVETLLAADIVTRSPLDAIDLLLHPKRLKATLRT